MTDAMIARTGPDHRAAYRPSTFADVLRSEWVKLRSVRSTFWALTVTVVLGIVLGAVISAVSAHGYARFSVSEKLSWDPTGISQAGVAIASLAIVVLGVLYISSEYSSGMIRTSLIAVPRRGRVLAAKSLVFAAVTFVVREATSFTAFFAGQVLISGHASRAASPPVDWHHSPARMMNGWDQRTLRNWHGSAWGSNGSAPGSCRR